MDIVSKARVFAIAAHTAVGQKRKYTNSEYWLHPAEVAEIVKTVSHTDEMLAAAWLHDVVEDTKVENRVIFAMFGREVADLVCWLTDTSCAKHGNRAARKAVDRAHIAAAPPEVKTIKLADLIHNTATIVEYDPDFAKVYLKEKSLLLEVLKEGDSNLWQQAYNQVNPPTMKGA